MAFRWERGSPEEDAAIRRWDGARLEKEWEAAGSAWARSAWETDQGPWKTAFAVAAEQRKRMDCEDSIDAERAGRELAWDALR